MEERTLKGVMADAQISQVALARVLHIGRATLNKKIKTGNFTVKEICGICQAVHLKDPVQIFNVFLREWLQDCNGVE